jgi:aspartyl-tRNA(Asn)/glutamyl-tRNA(Gln) amidotransferase subunit A
MSAHDETVAELAMLPMAAVAAALAGGHVTLDDVLSACQGRIRRFDATFRAFSHLAPASRANIARLQGELRSGAPRSALHGLTVSVKGNIPVCGMPWTEGSGMFSSRVATHDAAIVARARAAGAIIVGTTTLSELAMYGVRNAFEPMGTNPWCPQRTAGGSSTGGGVAACLGMAQVNIGTDSGGSVRNPACHMGIVGFMPGPAALPNAGVPAHVPSYPGLGFLCRSVEDAAIAFRTLRDGALSERLHSRRLVVPRRLIEGMCDGGTAVLFSAALRRIKDDGIALVEADVPAWRLGEAAAGVISLFESAQALSRMDLRGAGEGLVRRLAAGLKLERKDVDAARDSAAEFAGQVVDLLERTDADAIVTPTWPFAAPLLDADMVVVEGQPVSIDPRRNCFVRAANAAGAAAITLPMGLYPAEGVPAGLHLMSRPQAEERLLGIAADIERVLPRLPFPPPLRT